MFVDLPKPKQFRVLAFLAAIFLPSAVLAGGSAPILSITSADAVVTPAGVHSVAIGGTFNFDDLLQFSFPAGAIIAQGSHFVRYDLSGQIVEGTSTIVANGLTASQVPTVLTLGATAASPAAITQLRVDRISVALPSGFNSGPASVILYAELDGDSFVSNAVAVTLP